MTPHITTLIHAYPSPVLISQLRTPHPSPPAQCLIPDFRLPDPRDPERCPRNNDAAAGISTNVRCANRFGIGACVDDVGECGKAEASPPNPRSCFHYSLAIYLHLNHSIVDYLEEPSAINQLINTAMHAWQDQTRQDATTTKAGASSIRLTRPFSSVKKKTLLLAPPSPFSLFPCPFPSTHHPFRIVSTRAPQALTCHFLGAAEASLQ